MRLTTALLFAALLAPSVSEGQRRFQQVPEGIPITHKDVERLSPAGVVLSRREPLKLEKPQIAKLDSLRRAFEDTAKRVADNVKKYQRAINTAPPLLKRPPEGKPETRKDSLERAKLDSTNRLKRDKYFETVTTGRRDLAEALLALKELFDASLASTIQALNGAQHTTAALTLEQTSEEFTRRLRLANVR
jgi:hypothetical protein